MVDAIILFIAQFSMIYLLGFQQMNVAGKHYIAAAATSFLIGLSGWINISIISVANREAIFSMIFWVYAIAGPIAIVVAMKTHAIVIKFLFRK
jgi:hypothetical protein